MSLSNNHTLLRLNSFAICRSMLWVHYPRLGSQHDTNHMSTYWYVTWRLPCKWTAGIACFGASCCVVKRAFLLRQNVTLAAGNTVGCPCYEKTAVCCVSEDWPIRPHDSAVASHECDLFSASSKSIFHAVDAAQKMGIGVCVCEVTEAG